MVVKMQRHIREKAEERKKKKKVEKLLENL